VSRRHITLIGLGILILAQLAVPISMIQKRELTLKKGKVFRFKTEPVDPYDAFRGRYVAVNAFGARNVPVKDGRTYRRGQRVYVLLSTNDAGFASFAGVSVEPPEHEDYISMKVWYHHRNQTNTLAVTVPFDRYYMNEKLAPEAERVYREHSRRGKKQDAHMTVRVRRGFAVLEELYVADVPIVDFVKKQAERKVK